MQHIIRLLFFFLSFGLISCDPCDNLDCFSSNYYGQFRIVSKVDNKDLVFGPSSIYHKDSIKFYALKNGDTIFYETKAIRFSNAGYDSIITVNFFPETSTAFIQLNGGDIDTLSLTYISRDTKCCGTVIEINNFKFNNSTELGNNSETREIKK